MVDINGSIEYFVESFSCKNGVTRKQLKNDFPIRIISIQIKGVGKITTIVDGDLMPIVDTISDTKIVYPNIVLHGRRTLIISTKGDIQLRLVGEIVVIRS